MAYIGEMQYLTIGNNTYSLPTGGGGDGTVTSIGVANATYGGLSVSGSPITKAGTITIGHSNVLSSAQTTQAVYPIKIDKNGHISAYGSAVTIPTKTSDLTNDSGFITSSSLNNYLEKSYTNPDATYAGGGTVSWSHENDTSTFSIYSYGNWSLDEVGGSASIEVMGHPEGSNITLHTGGEEINSYLRLNGFQFYIGMNNTSYIYSTYDGIKVTNLLAPTNNTDAATKKYVDDSIGALTIPTKTSDLTNDSGFITSYTDEKLKWAASTSSNTYYPLQSTSTATTSTANTLNGISFYQYYNTAGGYRRLDLGNSTAYKSTGGAYGTIRLYGAAATYYGDLVPGVLGTTSGDGHISANRTWTLPDKTGTIALISDIPDVSSFITVDEKVKQSNNTTSNANLRILLSQSAIDTDQTSTVYKSTNLTYNPSTKTLSTDNLEITQLNGVTVGSSPKFTDSEVSTLTLASGSTTGTSLSFGSKYTLTAGSKTVSFTMPSSPTVPSITLNGSSTTSPSFYAPTSAGTNGYVLTSNGSGAPTWQEASGGAQIQIVRW